MLGPTGYSGFELLKILFRHPRVKSPVLFVREKAEGGPTQFERCVSADLREWHVFAGAVFVERDAEQAGMDLLFMATPHEFSRELMPEAMARGAAGHGSEWRVAIEGRQRTGAFTSSRTKRQGREAGR